MESDGKTGQQPKQERQRNVWHIDDVSEDVPAETHACPPCRKKFRHKFQLHRHALRKHDAWAAAPFHCGRCGIPFLFLARAFNPSPNITVFLFFSSNISVF